MLAPYVSYLHFSLTRMHHRWQMWEKAEHALEQTLVLDSASLVWEKKGKEIRVNGTFFDVKKIAYRNGKAIVTGIYDHFEKALVKSFEEEQEKQSSDNKQGNNLKKNWQIVFSQTTSSFVFQDWGIGPLIIPWQPTPKPVGQKNKPLYPPPQSNAVG